MVRRRDAKRRTFAPLLSLLSAGGDHVFFEQVWDLMVGEVASGGAGVAPEERQLTDAVQVALAHERYALARSAQNFPEVVRNANVYRDMTRTHRAGSRDWEPSEHLR